MKSSHGHTNAREREDSSNFAAGNPVKAGVSSFIVPRLNRCVRSTTIVLSVLRLINVVTIVRLATPDSCGLSTGNRSLVSLLLLLKVVNSVHVARGSLVCVASYQLFSLCQMLQYSNLQFHISALEAIDASPITIRCSSPREFICSRATTQFPVAAFVSVCTCSQ